MAELTCPGAVDNGYFVTLYSSDSKYMLLRLLEEEQPARRMARRVNQLTNPEENIFPSLT